MNLESLLYKALHLHPDDLEQGPGDEDLEKKLLNAFPQNSNLFPPFYRKLPRLHHKDHASMTKVKGAFRHLPDLKKTYMQKSLHAVFSNFFPLGQLQIVIFTWAMNDGLGDYFAQIETARLIQRHFPNAEIHLVTAHHAEKTYPKELSQFRFEAFPIERFPISGFPFRIARLLEQADVVLQIPTWFPQSELLPAHTISIGEYGSIDRAWFHPATEAHAMGLHALEKGVMLKEMPQNAALSQLQATTLRELLCQRGCRPLSLCYTKSLRGLTLFISTLLEYLRFDQTDLDILFSDLPHFEKLCQDHAFWTFLQSLPIGAIELHLGTMKTVKHLNPQGKTVRCIYADALCHEDFKQLLTISSHWVGCTGDGSISECLSANKLFFYDAPYHKRAFLKDMAALAEALFTSTSPFYHFLLDCLPPAVQELEDRFGNWIPEDALVAAPRDEPIYKKAQQLAQWMQHPEFYAHHLQFCAWIQRNHAFNPFLVQLIQRKVFMKHFPEYAHKEQALLHEFLFGKSPWINTLNEIRSLISSFSLN